MNVVKRVRSLEASVEWMVHHRRRQRVETSEVRQDAAIPLRTQREFYTDGSTGRLSAWQKVILDTSTTYVSMMLSCGKNQ